jgi:hypothetical protein
MHFLHTNGRDVVPNRYAAEHGNPTSPSCRESNIQLRFNGYFLIMSGPQGRDYAAVSGRPKISGGFDYSPTRQHESGEGPIPPDAIGFSPRKCGPIIGTTLRRVGHGAITASRFTYFQVRRPSDAVDSLFMEAATRGAQVASTSILGWKTLSAI